MHYFPIKLHLLFLCMSKFLFSQGFRNTCKDSFELGFVLLELCLFMFLLAYLLLKISDLIQLLICLQRSFNWTLIMNERFYSIFLVWLFHHNINSIRKSTERTSPNWFLSYNIVMRKVISQMLFGSFSNSLPRSLFLWLLKSITSLLVLC